MMTGTLSVDLDSMQTGLGALRFLGQGGHDVLYDALPRFLDLLDRYGMRATMFAVGRDMRDASNRSMVRAAASRGHEIANHSMTHSPGFAALGAAAKRGEIVDAEKAIADAVGSRPIGFRAPSYDVDASVLRVLAERGYLYDSSILPSPWTLALRAAAWWWSLGWAWPEHRFGGWWQVLAPRFPYRPRLDKPCRPGNASLVEVPISTCRLSRLPFYGTLHMAGGGAALGWGLVEYGREPFVNYAFHLRDLCDPTDPDFPAVLRRLPHYRKPLDGKTMRAGCILEALVARWKIKTIAEWVREMP